MCIRDRVSTQSTGAPSRGSNAPVGRTMPKGKRECNLCCFGEKPHCSDPLCCHGQACNCPTPDCLHGKSNGGGALRLCAHVEFHDEAGKAWTCHACVPPQRLTKNYRTHLKETHLAHQVGQLGDGYAHELARASNEALQPLIQRILESPGFAVYRDAKSLVDEVLADCAHAGAPGESQPLEDGEVEALLATLLDDPNYLGDLGYWFPRSESMPVLPPGSIAALRDGKLISAPTHLQKTDILVVVSDHNVKYKSGKKPPRGQEDTGHWCAWIGVVQMSLQDAKTGDWVGADENGCAVVVEDGSARAVGRVVQLTQESFNFKGQRHQSNARVAVHFAMGIIGRPCDPRDLHAATIKAVESRVDQLERDTNQLKRTTNELCRRQKRMKLDRHKQLYLEQQKLINKQRDVELQDATVKLMKGESTGLSQDAPWFTGSPPQQDSEASEFVIPTKAAAPVSEHYPIVLCFAGELQGYIPQLVAALEAKFGRGCAWHRGMTKPGQDAAESHFKWLQRAQVRLMLLSKGFFCDPDCKLQFKTACTHVPDPGDAQNAVLPIVVKKLPWQHPKDDPNCPADIQAQLIQRNCYPQTTAGALLDDFPRFMPGLIREIQPFIPSPANKSPQTLPESSPPPVPTLSQQPLTQLTQPSIQLSSASLEFFTAPTLPESLEFLDNPEVLSPP
eukprot:TRINITY_DN74_c0_g1_i4.p1 TRINITY_DN74_c0_g1~~TRINITY_DN74_c0_g1_i4.p1  ORF type:complete len:675 (-),score=123.74 TRINITY_DN74_c0_g1_i4:276-2300(-)